jgi:hypothetical protein
MTVAVERNFCVLRVPPIQISTQNEEMKVLFNKFHRYTNVMTFLVTILGSRNQNQYTQF